MARICILKTYKLQIHGPWGLHCVFNNVCWEGMYQYQNIMVQYDTIQYTFLS